MCSLLFVCCMFFFIQIMSVLVHIIWSIYARVMTPKIIVVFCINSPSLHFFVVFHPSPHLFIYSKILNEAKLIHCYINGNFCRFNPALNVLVPKLILMMMIYYFFVLVVFSNVNMWNWGCWWSWNQLIAKSFLMFPTFKLLSTINFICHLFFSLKNNYGV
jgi:hypothetical protein